MTSLMPLSRRQLASPALLKGHCLAALSRQYERPNEVNVNVNVKHGRQVANLSLVSTNNAHSQCEVRSEVPVVPLPRLRNRTISQEQLPRPVLDRVLGRSTLPQTSLAYFNEAGFLEIRERPAHSRFLDVIEVKTIPTHCIHNATLQQQPDEDELTPNIISFHRLPNQLPVHEDMTRKYRMLGSSRAEPIDLSGQRSSARQMPRYTTLDHDSDNEIDLTNENDELEVVRELTPHEARDFQQAFAQPNALPRGYKFLNAARGPFDIVVKPRMGVQLKSTENGETHFFWIKYIIRNDNGEVFLRGMLLKRNVDVHRAVSKETGDDRHAILPLRKNDVCMQLKSTSDKIGSPHFDECLSSIPLRLVEREREIVVTNYPFPAFSYQDQGMSVRTDGRVRVEEYGVLCCRWKYVEELTPGSRKPDGYLVSMLAQDECDKGKGRPSVEMRRGYGDQEHIEGEKLPSSKTKPTLTSKLVDLTIDPTKRSRKRNYEEVEENVNSPDRNVLYERRSTSAVEESFATTLQQHELHAKADRKIATAEASERKRKRTYTVGDACAGGGGTARGAEMAGLMPKSLLDNDFVAVNTLRQNWTSTHVLEIEIQQFALEIRFNNDYSVDVIHISFPCQGHSWLNRGLNPERDAINNATVMCLAHILKNYRPRIVTLEQTNHILTKNEGFFFRKVISQITSMGYGVRWRVINMAEHGVSQARHRLMIMAAAPGQRLPQWPAPTHGGPGLKPRVTLGEAIRNIPPWATLHNVEEQKELFKARPLKRLVADKNHPLQHLITTAGVQALLRDSDGEAYEPTLRQQMRLQTFPDQHVLTGSSKKDFTRQIGNAVPCVFMEQIFKEVIKALQESDEEGEAWEQEILTVD